MSSRQRFGLAVFGLLIAPLLIPGPWCLTPVLLAQWQPEQGLGGGSTSYNNAWCVAASGDMVHVVSWGFDSWGTEIYYVRSANGGAAWEPQTRLTNATGDSDFPSVGAWGSRVHVVWGDWRDPSYEIYYKRSDDGGAHWGPDVRLTNRSGDSWFPSLAVWGDTLHVVWMEGWSGSLIYYKRSTDGGASWQADIALTTGPASSSYPSVAVFGSDVDVVWCDARDGNDEIYYKRSTDAGSTWGPDIRLTKNRASSLTASVGVSDSTVHVVWWDTRDGFYQVYYKRSTDRGSTWEPDAHLVNTPEWAVYPSVAVSQSRVHVVWQDYRDGDQAVYYKRSNDAGATWEEDVRLSDVPGDANWPSVAVSGSMVHVVWKDDQTGLHYRRNLTGNIPQVAVDLDCLTPAVPRGGRLRYEITLTNNTSGPLTFQYWARVKLPSGSWYSRCVVPPTNVSLNPYEARTDTVSQTVPRNAPLGQYEYRGFVGTDTTAVWDSSSFPFTVTGGEWRGMRDSAQFH